MSIFNQLRVHMCAALHTFGPVVFGFVLVSLGLALFIGWVFLAIEVSWAFFPLPLLPLAYFCFRHEYKENVEWCQTKLDAKSGR